MFFFKLNYLKKMPRHKKYYFKKKVCPIVPPPRKALILLHLRWDKRLSRFVPFVPPTKRKKKKGT